MKNYSFIGFIITLSVILTGCFATLPPKINDVYLSDKSEKQAAQLESIEKEIIAITNDKEKLNTSLKINRQTITIEQKEQKRLEAVEELLKEKQKLNIIKEDSTAKKKTKMELGETISAQAATAGRITYLKAKEDNLEKQIEVKDAELAVKVAEQYLLKAKIGRANQEKMLSGTGSEKDTKGEKDLIDLSKYQKYYDSQKNNLEGSRKKLAESEKELEKAEKKIQETPGK